LIRQFVMIKPSAVKLGLAPVFFDEFQKKGLTLVWQKRMRLSRSQVEVLYHPYRCVYWFEEFVEVMTSGGVVISLWLGGEDATESAFEVRERLRLEYKEYCEYYDLRVADSEEIALQQLRFLIGDELDNILKHNSC